MKNGLRSRTLVGGNLDVMAITSQQPDESWVDAVVVEVEPHNPSLARSSFGRGRGLPLWRIAGSFMPIAFAKTRPFGWSSKRSTSVQPREGCVLTPRTGRRITLWCMSFPFQCALLLVTKSVPQPREVHPTPC